MNKSYAIGVDLGATNLRVGIVADDGKIELQSSVPVGKDKSAAKVCSLIAELVDSTQKQKSLSVAGCGCGIPGIVDAENGVVFSSPNYPEWKDAKILDLLKKDIDVPVKIDNDANMFALAELLFGAGRGHKNLIVLTLGSGIGGGIIIDGKIYHGDRGFAGEVGHIVIEPDGVPCGCGSFGCWEQYAASRAFSHLVHRLPVKEKENLLKNVDNDSSRLTPEYVAGLASGDNRAAKELWRSFGRYLGIGIASLINVLGITTVVIGGGITRSWELFIDAASAEISGRTYKKNIESLKLLKASLGEATGIVGAASLMLRP